MSYNRGKYFLGKVFGAKRGAKLIIYHIDNGIHIYFKDWFCNHHDELLAIRDSKLKMVVLSARNGGRKICTQPNSN